MKLITIFSAPKPFTEPHIARIQRNAIRSWLALGADVEVVLLGVEAGLAETAKDLGVTHLPQVKHNTAGTPLVSSMFALARQVNDSPLLACINADILLMPDFLSAARLALNHTDRFLVVGQRYDLDVKEDLDFKPGWDETLRKRIRTSGRLHPPAGSDYFLFPRSCFTEMPAFAIGRAGWDNWMIYKGRLEGWPVIDATDAITIAHQDHDYNHLPGGQTHYRLPETYENIRLAGGRRTIFHLEDASHRLTLQGLQPIPRRGPKFWRELELFPLLKLRSRILAQVSYALFHPRKAYPEFRQWLRGNREQG
jgi:hypothetical protein